MRPKFAIDPNNLDKSSAAAFREHAAGRLPYAAWKATAAQIQRLRGIESYRKAHGEALHNRAHPEHDRRAAELHDMYAQAYPEPATT
jgi:hypothetical protein